LPPGVKPPAAAHGTDHARKFDFREEAVDYLIPIGAGHPAALFWFHPHAHGIALNQVSGGLAGIITLEDVKADVCALPSGCKSGSRRPRHLIFKDIQITTDYQIRFQKNPAMCATPDAGGQIGGCAGAETKSGTSGGANDGRWEFTINGQTYPNTPIPPAGDAWRMVNASAVHLTTSAYSRPDSCFRSVILVGAQGLEPWTR
jgi:FtsP/CotA-like multicopper oxidase with cupredoxin domain